MRGTASVFIGLALLAVILSSSDRGSADGQADLTGTWAITFVEETIPLSGTCNAVVYHSGPDLVFSGECTLIGPVTLEGTFDESDQSFTMSGTLDAQGTATTNEHIEGTFSWGPLHGTFSGNRTSAIPPYVDLTGDWNMAVTSDASVITCSLSMQQAFRDVTAAINCGTLGSFGMEGRIDPATGYFGLMDPLSPARLEASAAADALTFSAPDLYMTDTVTGPALGSRKSGPVGDVTCTGTVDSVDALILLQLSAGLLFDLDCSLFADANGSGKYDALDAALVLQRTAGLIYRLPVMSSP